MLQTHSRNNAADSLFPYFRFHLAYHLFSDQPQGGFQERADAIVNDHMPRRESQDLPGRAIELLFRGDKLHGLLGSRTVGTR